MAEDIGSETVVVIRQTKQDPLDDATPGAAPEHEIEGCVILPRSSFELGKGWVTVEGRQVFAPFGSDILATDRVRTPDGLVWNVDGAPGSFKNKRGQGKAVIFYLERA